MMKRLGILCVVMAGVLGLVSTANAGTYSGGSGTEANPYQLATAADWVELTTTSGDWGSDYVLTADIDLAGVSGLTPVGNISTEFSGTLNGDGHVVSNATINLPASNYVGLFGRLDSGGEIIDLGVENVDITGDDTVGSLVGYKDGTVSGCYASGTVTGDNYVGGLVGVNYGTVSGCYATGSVTGSGGYVGGLVGVNHVTVSGCYASGAVDGGYDVGGLVGFNPGTVADCYSTSPVTGSGDYVGGLVGRNYYGTVSGCYATGAVSGSDDYVGGLVGANDDGTVTECYAGGTVDGADWYVGGLVGANKGAVSDCYASGSVTGHEKVGGLVGQNHDTISGCYAIGSVAGDLYVGGLVGRIYSGSVSASFWDVETSGTTDGVGNVDPDPAGATGKTTAQMMQQATFTAAGWDFLGESANGDEDPWRMCQDGVDYPRLRWEYDHVADWLCPDGTAMDDFSYLNSWWGDTGCDAANNYCDGVDIDRSGVVDLADLLVLAEHWLQ